MLKKIVVLALILLFVPLTTSAASKFEEGVNYFEIFPSYPDNKEGKVVVREFFWYSCPACYKFEPFVKKWAAGLGDDVEFIQVPAVFNKTARMHAEVFYALKLMGKAKELHDPIFNTIHQEKRKLNTLKDMEKFLAARGVDMAKFKAMRQSFAVQTQVNRAGALGQRYGISGVPSLVVNGVYRSGRNRNYDDVIELLDYLIDKERNKKQ